jgi:hypothetical protein
MNGLSQLEEYLTASHIDFVSYPSGGLILSVQQGLSTPISVMVDAEGWMYADACFPLNGKNVARIEELVEAISFSLTESDNVGFDDRQEMLCITHAFSSREATGAINRFIDLVDRYLAPLMDSIDMDESWDKAFVWFVLYRSELDSRIGHA